MFYNTEILTSRKGGFAVFWLAATLGSKGTTSVRKLSKKELLSCNVVKACEKVVSPDEPLALRLSSNLMVGIARVYQQQASTYTIYAHDVTQMHQSLKKVISEAFRAAPDINLGPDLPDLPLEPIPGAVAAVKDTALVGGINLQAIAHPDFETDFEMGLDWHLPGELRDNEFFEMEEEVFVSPLQSILGSPVPQPRQPPGAHQAREADITLHEPQLHDYMLEGYGADDAFHAGLEGEQFEGPAFGEGDEGLLYGADPELDAAIRAGSAGRRSAAGSGRGAQGYGASSSAVGFDGDVGPYGADLGGFEQHFDFGGGYEEPAMKQDVPLEGEGEDTFAERVRREHEEGQKRLEIALRRSATPAVEGDLSREFLESNEGTPSSTTRRRVSDALGKAQTKAAEAAKIARKTRRAKLLAVDRSTELSNEALRNMRATYAERMQVEREKAEQRKDENDAHQRAMDLVFGPPAFNEKKRRASGQPPTERKPKRTASEAEVARKAGDRLSEQPPGASAAADFEPAAQDLYAGREFGGGGYGDDLGGFQQHFDFEQVCHIVELALGSLLTLHEI
ncbi:hypothetical protein Rhopal_004714-T1 [Rhodotorula paludigena]|uniref:Rad21/Rec8-like protein N-terminal domain-containing protein n=1 Tax=Rhodotorula paludigena TaxID=86838 RepID=A0AAV5GQ85_9BASI|nr:hypothetical protein Rhopal_004714-T1 [Rhodotorula paludigena]